MSLAMAGATADAETWLTYSLQALLTFYPHWAGSDGGWAEGTAYGLWYNTFYLPAFAGLRQLAGYDLWQRPFFKNVRYFFFYCTANHGEIRPFGDGCSTPSRRWTSKAPGSPRAAKALRWTSTWPAPRA
jgi:hypothetical protein